MQKKELTDKNLKPEDKIELFFFNISQYLYEKKKYIIFILIGIIFIMLGIFLIYKWIEYQNNNISKQVYLIEEQLNKSNLSKNYSKDLIQLIQTFLSEHKNTKEYNIIQFYYADLLYKTNKIEESIKILNSLLNTAHQDNISKSLTAFYLSNIYRDQKQYEDAISTLQKIDLSSFEDMRLMELAETHLMFGNKKEAKKQLEILIQTFPSSNDLNTKAQILLQNL